MIIAADTDTLTIFQLKLELQSDSIKSTNQMNTPSLMLFYEIMKLLVSVCTRKFGKKGIWGDLILFRVENDIESCEVGFIPARPFVGTFNGGDNVELKVTRNGIFYFMQLRLRYFLRCSRQIRSSVSSNSFWR